MDGGRRHGHEGVAASVQDAGGPVDPKESTTAFGGFGQRDTRVCHSLTIRRRASFYTNGIGPQASHMN